MEPSMMMAVGVAGLAVLGLALAVWQFLSPERSASDRLAEFTGGERDGAGTRLSALTRSAAKLSRGDETEIVATRRWLSQAGIRGRNAAEIYSAGRTMGLVFGALLGFLLVLIFHKGEAQPADMVITATQRLRGLSWYMGGTLVGAAMGYYGPQIYVANAIAKRKERLIVAFPDALDLLVSAVEAGLALDAGFRRVADEMEIASPELAGELQLVNHEVMAGVQRVDALRHLEERVGLDDVSSLVNVLIQAERFGSSVARALRVHSGHIRVKRMQRAETKAAQVSPKLTVVMIVFILPTLLIVLLGPAAVRMKNILIPTAQEQGVAP
jgi:tight adherence protein C